MTAELTVRQAARRVGRADETIRRWIWAGKLPARKLGNTYRMLASDVDAVARGVPAPRQATEDHPTHQPNLDDWLGRVQRWQAGNDVEKRAGAWRLVVEDRAERSELAGS